ncbi:MAG TPA: hypothetical protein VKH18_08060 [Terriglobales bacterium]|nr:hypothetical protein [Terriglobales bacterium]
MKYLILTVLLATVQIAPPVPGKAADNPAQTPAQVKSDGNASQAKSLPASAPVKTDGSGPAKTDSGEQHPDDAQHTVGISKLPAVTITPAKRDWAYWGFNFLLAATSGFQVYLLFRTLRAVNRQAEETGRQVEVTAGQLRAMHEQITEMSRQTDIIQKSVRAAEDGAEAAKKNVDFLVSKERARISVEIPSKLDLGDGFFNNVKYRIHIFAPTPAVIVSAEANAGTNDEITLKYRFTHTMGITSIEARQTTVIEKSTYLIEVVDAKFRQAIYDKQEFVHFYGFVKYRDIFQSETDEPHETRFGYVWMVGADIKGGFLKMGEGR